MKITREMGAMAEDWKNTLCYGDNLARLLDE